MKSSFLINHFANNHMFIYYKKILVNKKHFLIKKNSFVYKKIFYFYFGWKTLSRNYEKFKNILLIIDYIKFDHQFFLLLYILF
jgi:hypothetical protein